MASFYYVVTKLVAEQLAVNKVFSLLNASSFGFILALVMVLMVFNWLIEAKKWQILAQNITNISFSNALKAILAGVSLDAVLPFGAGALSSKLLSLKGVNKKQLIAPVVVSQGTQSFWTVAFGLIGLSQLASYINLYPIYNYPTYYLLFVSLGVVAIIVLIRIFKNSLFEFIINSIKKIPLNTWSVVALLSMVRYLLFLIQLMLISIYLAPEVPVITLLGCITWMFFAKTIVPKPGHLGALGIRGASIVFFLNLAGYASSEVVLASIILWMINLAIPSLVGLYFMKDLNLKSSND